MEIEQDRVIALGPIEHGTATLFARQLHELLVEDASEPISVLINSPGGSWDDACAIYDLVAMCPVEMTAVIMGSCMSAAVYIAQAFTHRLIYPSTTVMVHDGSFHPAGDAEHVRNIEAWAVWLKHNRERMYEVLAARTTKSARWWRNKCAGPDFIITAAKAVELGLADEVYDGRRVCDQGLFATWQSASVP